MLSAQAILLAGLGLLGTTSASPATPIGSPLKVVPIGPEISPTPLALPSPTPMALNNLSSPYTVTAYVPWNCDFNGLKIENWDLFVSTVASYCPFLGTGEASSCPNGTDMVLEGSLYPVCSIHRPANSFAKPLRAQKSPEVKTPMSISMVQWQSPFNMNTRSLQELIGSTSAGRGQACL